MIKKISFLFISLFITINLQADFNEGKQLFEEKCASCHKDYISFKKLKDAGAEGTQEALHYAFGLHINPEVPKMEVEVILPFVQAFLLMSDWIIDDSDTDFSRR